MEVFYYKSLIGILEIITDNNKVSALKLTKSVVMKELNNSFHKKIKIQLDEYFCGKRKNFDIAINPDGTDFQKKVWNELIKIPYSKTKSYSDIADAIGNKNASRAVGNACNKNPIMIIIPCHRVLPKSGKIGGFAYGATIKEKLLNLEYMK